MSQNSAGTIAGLPPALQEALRHDAACEKSGDSTGADAAEFLDSPIAALPIRGAAGAEVGMIVAPQNGCHCREANCTTYVYLKSGPTYKLAFSRVFSSLHPMRVFKRGVPSLTGKLQVDEAKAETMVYDWTGSQYQPSLCATLTQAKSQKRPTIVRHQCNKAP